MTTAAHVDQNLPNLSVAESQDDEQKPKDGTKPKAVPKGPPKPGKVLHKHLVIGSMGHEEHSHSLPDGIHQHSHLPDDPLNKTGKELMPLMQKETEAPMITAAELDADARNALDDSDFAYIDSEGGRHLPIHDAAHVKAAMGGHGISAQKFGSADDKRQAARKILAKSAKLGIEVSDDSGIKDVVAATEFTALEFAEWAKDLARQVTTSTPAAAAPPLRVAAAEPPQVLALDFGETMGIPLDERTLPYLVEGHWNFPNTDIGKLDIGVPELHSIVKHFRENVRGQDLPICDIDHKDPAFRGAAVGWVTSLTEPYVDQNPSSKTFGKHRIDAVVDLNPVGERLRADDQFRYVSPTLLRNWPDPVTGEVWSMVAAGVDVRTRGMAFDEQGKPVQTDRSAMALTNKPRLKQLGRIAASEGTEALVLAISNSDTSAETNPARVARLLSLADQEVLGNAREPLMVTTMNESHQRQHNLLLLADDGTPTGGKCPTCKGEGTIRGGAMKCPDCKGSGTIKAAEDGGAADGAAPDQDPDDTAEPADPKAKAAKAAAAPHDGAHTDLTSDIQTGLTRHLTAAPEAGGHGLDKNSIDDKADVGAAHAALHGTNAQQFAEAQRRHGMADKATTVQAGEGDGIAPTAETPPAVTPPAADAQVNANLAEDQNISLAERRTLEARIEAAERSAAEARAEADKANAAHTALQMAERQARVADRLGALLRTGRISAADHTKLAEPAHMVKLAEDEDTNFVLEMLEAKTPYSIAGPKGFTEQGSGVAPDPNKVDSEALWNKTKEISEAAVVAGKPISMSEAGKRASRELYPAGVN